MGVALSALSFFSTQRLKSTFPRSRVRDISLRISISFSRYAGAMRADRSIALLLSDLISTFIFFSGSSAVGDKVVTAGGIYGKIKEIKDNIIVLEIADNVRIRIDKSSIYATAADSTTTNQA